MIHAAIPLAPGSSSAHGSPRRQVALTFVMACQLCAVAFKRLAYAVALNGDPRALPDGAQGGHGFG